MTNHTEGKWAKWAWCYHTLEVDFFSTFDSAVRSAQYAEDNGEESLDSIEAPDGSVVPESEVEAAMQAVRDSDDAARGPSRPANWRVEVQHAEDDDQWGRLDNYADRADADEAAATCEARFPGRVRVVAMRPWAVTA